jgi:hypothetical protein
MNRNSIKMLILILAAALTGILAFHLSRYTHVPHIGVRLFALWVLAGGLCFLGYTNLSRFTLAITLTALAAPFFHGQDMRFGPLSLFNWVGFLLLLLLTLNWLDMEDRVPKATLTSSLLLAFFLGVPMLMFFQLNPLMEEVYAQPLLTGILKFLPIFLGFLIFLLGLNLRQNVYVFILLGAPLTIPIFQGFFR